MDKITELNRRLERVENAISDAESRAGIDAQGRTRFGMTQKEFKRALNLYPD